MSATTARPALERGHELKERVRRSLPTIALEQIRIASPCTVSWDSMQGDERSRHCGQCEKSVHDLSRMSRAQAEALVSGGEKVCVRLWVRKDGTVLTQDCPVGLAKVRRHLRRIGAAFGALLGALVGLTGCTGDDSKGPGPGGKAPGGDEPVRLMGEVCAPDVAPPASDTSTGAQGVAPTTTDASTAPPARR